MPTRPKLSLAMIVRDEAAMIANTLANAAPWVDEMIVVDTGSEDDTAQIASACGARVLHYAWPDHFSMARNVSLRACSGEWILWLDADERIEGANPQGLRQNLPSAAEHPRQVFLVEQINATLDGVPQERFHIPRIFPNNDAVGYRGRVHNRLVDLSEPPSGLLGGFIPDLRVIHFGYDPAILKAKDKHVRSLRLMRMALAEDPTDAAMRYYLARELLSAGEVEQAIETYQAAIVMLKTSGDLGSLHDAYCQMLEALGQTDATEALIQSIAEEACNTFAESPDLWLSLAVTFRSVGLYDQALDACHQASAHLDAPPAAPNICSIARAQPWLVAELHGDILDAAGRPEEGAQQRAIAAAQRRDAQATADLGIASLEAFDALHAG